MIRPEQQPFLNHAISLGVKHLRCPLRKTPDFRRGDRTAIELFVACLSAWPAALDTDGKRLAADFHDGLTPPRAGVVP
jgi:hypothetical protein